MPTPKRSALGRGLNALLPDSTPFTAGSTIFNEIDINDIHPNPNQPRTDFNQEALEELAESIKNNGIITPITLRKEVDGSYQIVAGERRFRAAQMAGLNTVPAYIREVDDDKVLELALIENIQREDLNAIEIALSYSNLASQLNITQDELARRVGKKRSTITNYIRLLSLPAEIQLGLKEHKIEMGHARALAGIDNPEDQMKIYRVIVDENASVRRAEELVKKDSSARTHSSKSTKFLPEQISHIQSQLSEVLHASVKLRYNERGKGSISINFSNDSELARLMSIFDNIH